MAFSRSGEAVMSETYLPLNTKEEKKISRIQRGTTPITNTSGPDSQIPTKAMSARRMLFALAVCMLVTMGLASITRPNAWIRMRPCHGANADTEEGALQPAAAVEGSEVPSSTFPSLLRGASPESLHELLHRFFPESFRHGVWASEQEALEAVHRENADLASTIVQMAKRDSGSGSGSSSSNSTSVPPPESSSSSTSAPAESSPPTSSTPVVPPTSSSSTTTSVPSTPTSSSSIAPASSLPPTSSSSTTAPVTNTPTTSSSTPPSTSSSSVSTPSSSHSTSPGTSSSLSQTASPSTSQPASSSSSPSSTQASSSLPATSSTAGSTGAASSSTSPGSVSSSSTGGGSTLSKTTSAPKSSSSSQSSKPVTTTFTSTELNGSVAVVTETSFVEADPVSTPGASTTAPQGSLQTNAAQQVKRDGLVLGAAVVGALAGGVLLA